MRIMVSYHFPRYDRNIPRSILEFVLLAGFRKIMNLFHRIPLSSLLGAMT